MMPFHLSILITPIENRESKRWGWRMRVAEEELGERKREGIMGIALSRDSLLFILNVVNYNVISSISGRNLAI